MAMWPSPKEYDGDGQLLQSCTDAVQAQERFFLKLRTKQQEGMQQLPSAVMDEAGKALDTLREVRSQLEGTAVNFQPTCVEEPALQQLKQLMLMHIPTSLTPDVRESFRKQLSLLFGDSVKRVLLASLLTNPWYCATQEDRGLQAKHNALFVVFQAKDEQFFSPANPHLVEQSNVIDKGWFYAAEVSHYASYLVRGKSRFVETLFTEAGILYQDADWLAMKQAISTKDILGLKGFIEQCGGQAVGVVAKKRKSGKMGPRDAATLYEHCESFQLLHQAEQAITQAHLNVDQLVESDLQSESSKDALLKLRKAYQMEYCDKAELLEVIMEWKADIDKSVKSFKFTSPNSVVNQVGKWLAGIRKGPQFELNLPVLEPSRKENLKGLMQRIGGPVAKMAPEQILMIAQAGSHLYNLSTPDSDVDFVVIYMEPLEKVVAACKRCTESFEDRGPSKTFEYGAYEARLFCEMVLKGSVVILELLFAQDVNYCSPALKALISHRKMFVTEKGILQYLGLIRNNMVMIESKKHIGTSRDRKLFYQVFHKLHSLEYFLNGEIPQIHCSGEVREFIMKIRKGPLEGEIERKILYELAQKKIKYMKERLANREKRLPENISFEFMTQWLMAARGWSR